MKDNIKEIIDAASIQKRIEQLGKQISKDYNDKEVIVLGILQGAFMFMADLTRTIDIPLHCEFMRISSYGDAKVSSGKVKIVLDIGKEKIHNKHVIVVEDIVDTGNSLVFLKEHLSQYQPASLKLCSLLLKEKELKHELAIDYLRFYVDSLFIVGYGLDCAGIYRNLPYIGVLLEEGESLPESAFRVAG